MTKKTETKTATPKTQTKKELSKPMNKTLMVMEALSREDGVTIDELTEMTGWKPHSARGFLSNIRKKLKETKEDSQIVKYTRDGKTMYKLEPLEKAEGQTDE